MVLHWAEREGLTDVAKKCIMKEARKGDGGKLKAAAAAEEDYYVTFSDVLTPRRNIWV